MSDLVRQLLEDVYGAATIESLYRNARRDDTLGDIAREELSRRQAATSLEDAPAFATSDDPVLAQRREWRP